MWASHIDIREVASGEWMLVCIILFVQQADSLREDTTSVEHEELLIWHLFLADMSDLGKNGYTLCTDWIDEGDVLGIAVRIYKALWFETDTNRNDIDAIALGIQTGGSMRVRDHQIIERKREMSVIAIVEGVNSLDTTTSGFGKA